MFNSPGNTDGNKITSKILALHGNDDPMVPHDSVNGLADELTKANADWQIHAYGGTSHAFTNPLANAPEDGMAFNENANEDGVGSNEQLEEIFLNHDYKFSRESN